MVNYFGCKIGDVAELGMSRNWGCRKIGDITECRAYLYISPISL